MLNTPVIYKELNRYYFQKKKKKKKNLFGIKDLFHGIDEIIKDSVKL